MIETADSVLQTQEVASFASAPIACLAAAKISGLEMLGSMQVLRTSLSIYPEIPPIMDPIAKMKSINGINDMMEGNETVEES